MTLSNSVLLHLVRGVDKALSSDSGSADALNEQTFAVFDLLNANAGLALASESDWIPGLATVEGVWGESAIRNGRELAAAKWGNVKETITLNLGGDDPLQRYGIMRKLSLLARQAEAYWDTFGEIQPVYLKWQALGAPGPQYARIYTIDIANQTPAFETGVQTLTLSIEREEGWAMAPIGANPKLATQEIRGITGAALADMKLFSGTDSGNSRHLIYGVLKNRCERDPLVAGEYTAFLSKNFVDIPASDIPGDLPALLELDIVTAAEATPTIGNPASIWVGLQTKPQTLPSRDGTPRSRPYFFSLNTGDAQVVNIVTDATNGVFSNDSSVNRRYHSVAGNDTLYWGNRSATTPPSRYTLDINSMRGRYAVFVRYSQSGGAAGNFTFTLRVRHVATSNNIIKMAQEISLPAIPSALASANFWDTLYLGEITIPLSEKVISAADGWGLDVGEVAEDNLWIMLDVTHLTGTATMRTLDLLLLPFDHWALHITGNLLTGQFVSGQECHHILDNTGYLAHGENNPTAKYYLVDAGAVKGTGVAAEFAGGGLYLLPGVDNRLVFFVDKIADISPSVSHPARNITVRGNIIPRWSSARDR